ncbi:MAG: 7-cyano-7-deazaguanine synthase QueC [Deltaproteobacteria bacterium]|nr:7-cyano-7-deazaguanine synthase QueC [Deltaproteobacteria bacterium]
MKEKAIVLLSGGIDSATCLAVAKKEGFDLYALSFRYGQRHQAELTAAAKVAESLGVVEHIVFGLDLSIFGGSALTGSLEVPKGRAMDEIGNDIPITYVPARNTIFLSIGMAYAEVRGASSIFAGMNAVDYSGYPDCRPVFIAAFERMANLATKAAVTGEIGLQIRTPLISLSKAEIISFGNSLGVDYSLTLSCYDPDQEGRSCGRCDSCIIRMTGFREAEIPDPTIYQD